jgi:hypothetical protein
VCIAAKSGCSRPNRVKSSHYRSAVSWSGSHRTGDITDGSEEQSGMDGVGRLVAHIFWNWSSHVGPLHEVEAKATFIT